MSDRLFIKHRKGVYRTKSVNGKFGQTFNSPGRGWLAEIRDSDTGQILRFAGSWKTRTESIQEMYEVLEQ